MRFSRNWLAGLLALIPLGAFAPAISAADPKCTSVGGVHACSGASDQINIGGQSIGASGGGETPQLPATVSVTCGTQSEKQLGGLGDLTPNASHGTCATQSVACATQSTAAKKQLDPVVTVEKQQDGTWQYAGNDCVGAGPAQVTAAMVREQAVRLVPVAAVGVAPKGTTLVNIETVLWADAPRQQTLAPVMILGQQVVVRLVLDHVAWDFGDGQSDGAGPAGKAYDGQRDPCRSKTCPSYFGHTYTRTGMVTVAATATWQASFSVGGGAPVDIPGTVDGPAGQATIVVKQARGVLVPNPGEQP